MKKTYHTTFLAIFLFISFFSQAQKSSIFNGIKFDESLLTTQKKLNAISDNIKVIKTVTPSFPLSKNKEEHLIATMVKVENGTIYKVVFTFSDDKLSYIQAKGNVVKGLTSNIKSEFKTYLDYQIYKSDLLFINAKKDLAWLLTPESAHPNLFTWNNPYLNCYKGQEIKYNPSVKTPSFIKMGKNMDHLMPLLKSNSQFIEVKKIKETDSITKTQINCFGIEYAGFPRKFEARFENSKLNMVWILTGKGEETRIRKKLTEEYGKALFVNDNWEVFNNWTVLLRKDKPEVLLLTKELALMYKKQYSK
ncbi:hypothetical protein [Thalassobellus citreus]|uniref:hypothetical protein n=1 Tax=Thalassobellus citreus TaxID=3367752 RepID=UPI0037920694